MSDADSNSTGESADGNDVTLKDVYSELEALKQDMSKPEPSTVKDFDELQKTMKEGEGSVVVELGKDFTLTRKEDVFEDMAELLDYLENDLQEENFSMLMDAVRGSQEQVEEETDEEDDDMEKQETEKSADDEPKAKGADEESVREQQVKSRNKEEGTGQIRPFKNQVQAGAK